MHSWFLLLLLSAAPVGSSGSEVPPAAAVELEGRLMAPCCWKQTLDVHASPSADQLRREIRTRVAAGESVDAIEADLVARHGEKLRALPRAGFMTPYGVGLTVIAALALVILVALGRRRVDDAPPDVGAAHSGAAQALLAKELQDLD